jgi:PQQ-dependent catabolism-associated CXXCW motif protein
MTSQISRLALAAALMLLPPAAALAQTQDDNFGGSFEPDAPAPVVAPAPAPAAADDNFGGDFGGSFDDAGGTPTPPPPPSNAGGGALPPPPPPAAGGGTPPPPPPPPDQPPEPAPTPATNPNPDVIGGGDFDGGSFDDPQPPQPQPPQPQPQPPQPQPPAPAGVDVPDQVTQLELQDFGIPPTSSLRGGPFHAATPTLIPGGQVVTTKALADAMNAGTRIVLIDVLGANYSLPGAIMAPALAQGGSFQDRLQQQATLWLGQVTGGDPSIPIVIYCSDPMCWLSYNAALRTIAAGYGNVYWYRGGLHAWQMAGFSLQPSAF